MTDDAQAPAAPSLTVTPGGPYVLRGAVPVHRRTPVTTDQGEPVTWATGEDLEHGDPVSLCRCGRSGNKPFCDGSHRTADWDGTESAPTSTYAERAKDLGGTGVSLHDDRGICEHAGFCATKATNVWKMVESTGDTAVRSQLMAMVERCPSGALTYAVPGVEDDVEPLLPVAVSVLPDGPLAVTGGLPVTRADGRPFEARNRMTLCRCGASSSKPLCDGSHAKVGFRG